MGMWQGIAQGLQDVQRRKEFEEELELRRQQEERIQAQFDENKKLKRLTMLKELGLVKAQSTAKNTEIATAQADAVIAFRNRMNNALKNLNPDERNRLQTYTEQLTQSPARTLEVLNTLNKLNESGSNIQITEVPDIFQIIAFSEGSGEETRKTLAELYNLDLNDDAVFEELVKTAQAATPSRVVVDYDTSTLGTRKPEELKAQKQFVLPLVIRAARAAQANPNDPRREDITKALDDINSSTEAIRVRAEAYLFEQFFSLEQATTLQEEGGIYYRGLLDNPLISPYLVSRPVTVEEPTTKVFPTPTPQAVAALMANPTPDMIKQFNDFYGPNAADQYLQ
jgi:hypothetical protein